MRLNSRTLVLWVLGFLTFSARAEPKVVMAGGRVYVDAEGLDDLIAQIRAGDQRRGFYGAIARLRYFADDPEVATAVRLAIEYDAFSCDAPECEQAVLQVFGNEKLMSRDDVFELFQKNLKDIHRKGSIKALFLNPAYARHSKEASSILSGRLFDAPNWVGHDVAALMAYCKWLPASPSAESLMSYILMWQADLAEEIFSTPHWIISKEVGKLVYHQIRLISRNDDERDGHWRNALTSSNRPFLETLSPIGDLNLNLVKRLMTTPGFSAQPNSAELMARALLTISRRNDWKEEILGGDWTKPGIRRALVLQLAGSHDHIATLASLWIPLGGRLQELAFDLLKFSSDRERFLESSFEIQAGLPMENNPAAPSFFASHSCEVRLVARK
jgi:hypothetical protein